MRTHLEQFALFPMSTVLVGSIVSSFALNIQKKKNKIKSQGNTQADAYSISEGVVFVEFFLPGATPLIRRTCYRRGPDLPTSLSGPDSRIRKNSFVKIFNLSTSGHVTNPLRNVILAGAAPPDASASLTFRYCF